MGLRESSTRNHAGAVHLIHLAKGWRFWGFEGHTGNDIGDWSTLDEAIAAMEAAGFSGLHRVDDRHVTFRVRS